MKAGDREQDSLEIANLEKPEPVDHNDDDHDSHDNNDDNNNNKIIMMTVTIKSLPTLRNQGLMIDRIYCILVWMNTQWDKYLMMVLLSYIASHW